jgi:nicotinate (nicotinamide) nucleotide adenylyltransferase
MVRLLVADDPRFEVDPIEIDREGLSYTVDTLATYAERHAAAERYFLVGADVLTTFHQWREPGRVLALARLVVLRRATDGGTAGLPPRRRRTSPAGPTPRGRRSGSTRGAWTSRPPRCAPAPGRGSRCAGS